MRKIYFASCVALLSVTSATAQVVRDFTPRFTIDTKGQMVFVSNNIITTKQRAGGNAVNYTTLPPGCPATPTLCKNDGEYNTNIDIDGDPTTVNSSSASITLPDCSGVAYAALYWGAGIAAGQGNNGPLPMRAAGWNQVRFKTPGGTYQTVTADRVDTVTNVFHGYQSVADVTSLVRSGGSGYYTIADVKCDTINSANQPIVNAYGGWTMVVIYRDSTMPLRNMTIFDGLAVVRNTVPYNVRTISVTGFQCPPTGDVSAKLGMIVYDGDRGEADGFEVKRNSDGVFRAQTDAGEGADAVTNASDAWNSSITDTTSAATARIPAHHNTYGYDAHVFKLNNSSKQYLRNGDNTAEFRLRTSSEGYVLGVVTAEIDTYEPEMLMENTIENLNGPGADKGDTLQINTRIRNTGTDLATQVRADSRLPVYLKYVPNSIVINGVAKSDANGDDEAGYDPATQTVRGNIGLGSSPAIGGEVSANNLDNYGMTYKVTISTDCADIGVTPLPLLFQSKLFYSGLTSGAADSAASRPAAVNSCVQPMAPDTIVLSAGCGTPLPVRLLGFSANPQTEGTLVSWRVEEHNDGKSYTLEYSLDGSNFNELYVQQVPLQEGVFSYKFLDAVKRVAKTVYYRLVMRSIDGTVEYSRTISVRSDRNAKWDLTPNPAKTTVTVRSSAVIDRLEWYNTSGQLLKTVERPVNGQTIIIADLIPGIYFVKSYTDNEVSTTKMIKR